MDPMQKIISLSKRRGFVFPSSEIYGGFGSSYDFGPLGVLLKNNIKQSWRDEMLQKQDNIVGLDAAILMSPKVWEASGHLTAGFADELVECLSCHKRFRIDEIKKDKCPECGGEITKPKQFNLMMKTFVGSTEDESSIAYLRAETCQGIYINFKNVLNSARLKLPFGIAQIGKSFRNEITTKNFIFRMREFEQMEMQWFCHPKEADKWFEYWKEQRLNWYLNLGVKKENLKLFEVPDGERAHYARRQIDLEYNFPFGWQEIEGIHNRGDWDLSQHQKHSGEDLSYKDPDTGEEFIPYIIETSVGVERSLLAFFTEAYQEISGGRTETTEATKEEEIILKLDKKLAPIKVAIMPLVKNKPDVTKKAQEVYKLIKLHFMTQYDESGSIGRRYRRQDEIGTLYCVTIDFDTLDDNDVTVRDRDTMKQKRVKIEKLLEYLNEKLN
ncbi:MAG: glycine--tRNA ligase [Candidatus Parcubacteria bacterium]|nr:glycine--tRNA ligase [Candidatus Parcubacteria bacterium]